MKERETKRESGGAPEGERRPPRVIVPELAAFRGSLEDILLRKEERAHVRSRRLRDGEEVVVLDGLGARARGCLARGRTAIRLLSFDECPGLSGSVSPSSSFASLPGEPSLRVTVLLACAEPARVEWAVEKGTECGAAAFVLIEAARSQRAHVTALRARLDRLSRIAAEATKQCDRTIVPTIEGPERTEDFLRREEQRRKARRPILLADARGEPVSSVLSSTALSDSSSRGLFVAIGPEGGWTPAEISIFEGLGALRFSLGRRILRLETAVVAALALLVGDR